jgi:hypothetical protein
MVTSSDDYVMTPGFNAGVTFEIGFGSLFAVEAGLIAETKGFKFSESGNKLQTNALYVDVPVLVKVGPSFGPIKVFAAAGPYIGMGVTGKYKITISGDSETTDLKWGSDDDSDLKRMDFGAKFGVGAELSGLTFGVYYALSIANLSPTTDNGDVLRNKVLSVSVGYRFGGK